MAKKLYIVAYRSDTPYRANGIVYIGFDRELAEKIHSEHSNTVFRDYYFMDSTINGTMI